MKIAVVGTGIAGLVTLYTIQKHLGQQVADHSIEVVAFERTNSIGGEWIFDEEAEDVAIEGIPSKSSIYKGMQTNFEKSTATLHSDFPWPRETPLYPSSNEMLAYIQSFAAEFNLTRFVKFSTVICEVEQDSDSTDLLLLRLKNLTTGEITNEKFNFVFLCVGQHRIPYIPISEVDTLKFNGRALHYHDLNDPARLAGKRVLIVGSSFAAMDLISLLSGKAKELHLSWHSHYPFWFSEKVSNFVTLRPTMTKAEGSAVTFADGTTADVDVILYATGFRQHHPLSDKLQLDFDQFQSFYPLYKHVVHPACPNLFFIGKSFNLAIQMSRLQAEFACVVIDGRVKLPSKEDMQQDVDAFRSRWLSQVEKINSGSDLTTYFPIIFELEEEVASYLASTSSCEPIPVHVKSACYETVRLMKSDALGYRSEKSEITFLQIVDFFIDTLLS